MIFGHLDPYLGRGQADLESRLTVRITRVTILVALDISSQEKILLSTHHGHSTQEDIIPCLCKAMSETAKLYCPPAPSLHCACVEDHTG